MEKEEARIVTVSRYLEPVRRFASFLARADFDSDDLVGETMLAGVKRSVSGETPERWTTWFRGVVRNLVRRRIRERKRHRNREEVDCEFVENPLARIQQEEMRNSIKTAISRLPESPRAVFELAYRGYSRPEIARRLGLSLPAVQARWFRGVRILRLELSGILHAPD